MGRLASHNRYVVMTPAEAQAAGIADPPYCTWEEDIERAGTGWDEPSNYVVDTVDKVAIGCDGGEPEDQTLRRDWAWVVGALNDAYERGRDGSR